MDNNNERLNDLPQELRLFAAIMEPLLVGAKVLNELTGVPVSNCAIYLAVKMIENKNSCKRPDYMWVEVEDTCVDLIKDFAIGGVLDKEETDFKKLFSVKMFFKMNKEK